MQLFLPHMLESSASAIKMLHKSKTCCTKKSSGDRNTARVFFSFRWLKMRDSWSSGPYSTSQTVSCPNKQTLKTPQTSRVHSSCGLNTPSLQTHTGFIIVKSPAAVCSSLLHSSREWTTYSWQPPGSRQYSPHPLWTPYQCVQSSLCPVYRKKVSSAFLLFFFCFNTSTLTRWFISPNTEPKFVHTHTLVLLSLWGHNKHISLSANTTAVKLSLVQQNLLNAPTF